jgi:hypothetical protein
VSAVFSRISRYRNEDDVSIVDAAGRTQLSKALRLTPTVEGKFRHTLADGDRADELAYKYYKQPRKWWRICDANPEFMSPQALLGKDALAVARFAVETGGTPPWAALLAALESRVGVETARLEERWSLAAEPQVVDGQEVTVNVERIVHTVIVTYNRLNASATGIAAVIAGFGLEVGEPQPVGRAGKPIVIPPDNAGLRA